MNGREEKYLINLFHLFSDNDLKKKAIEKHKKTLNKVLFRANSVKNKEKPSNLEGFNFSLGDTYGIRTRECMRERHVS